MQNVFHQYVAENLESSVQMTLEIVHPNLDKKSCRVIHKGRVYGLGSWNDVKRLQSSLRDIGSSHQAEALKGVQIVVISAHIAQHISALAESK